MERKECKNRRQDGRKREKEGGVEKVRREGKVERMKEERKSEEKNYLGDTYPTLNSGYTTLLHTFLFSPYNSPFLDKKINVQRSCQLSK